MGGRTYRTGLASALIVTVTAFGLEGCAAVSQPGWKQAAICGGAGAVVGGAAGAGIGAARGGGSRILMGALIGAGVGAVVGAGICFAVTYKSQPAQGYNDTRRATGYDPRTGTVVQVTKLETSRNTAAPGDKVPFRTAYHVMTPDPDQEVTIVETQIVTAVNPSTGERQEVGRQSNRLTVKPGTREGSGQLDTRRDLREGTYEIALQVEAEGKSDVKGAPVTVSKKG